MLNLPLIGGFQGGPTASTAVTAVASERREALGLTQSRRAQLSGLSWQTLVGLEAGAPSERGFGDSTGSARCWPCICGACGRDDSVMKSLPCGSLEVLFQ
jgi:hypothetical protein